MTSLGFVALALACWCVAPPDPPRPPAALPAAADHSAVTPVPREEAWWLERHAAMNRRVAEGDVSLLFIGDSITQGWEDDGKEVWAEFYGKRRAVNLGVSGDRTQHVLWRLANGNLAGLERPAREGAAIPRLAIVMIGTNNSISEFDTPRRIADGIAAVVKTLREKLPQTKVLVLAIFPRSEKPDRLRQKNAEASQLVKAEVADGKDVHFLDIGDQFVGKDGTIDAAIMADYLHLTPKGYRLWADAIEPKVKELLGEKAEKQKDSG